MPLPLDATNFENGYPTTKELVCSAFVEEIASKVYFAHTFTCSHPAMYPFMPSERHLSIKGHFLVGPPNSAAVGNVRLASKAAHKNQCTVVVSCETGYKMHIAHVTDSAFSKCRTD